MLPNISKLVEGSLSSINTVRIAEVVSFGQSSTGAPLVEARPLITGASGAPFPSIIRVPVVYPMSGSRQMGIAYSLEVGDVVVLLFNQESLDEWLEHGGPQEAEDTRTFDLSDAIAVPGIVPRNNDFVALPDSDYVRVGDLSSAGTNARLELTDKVWLGNDTVNLLAILEDLLTALESTIVATSLGSQPLSSATTISGLKTTLATIKGT